MVGGLLLTIVAFYIFYLQPWFGASLPIDNWLAGQACLLDSLCDDATPLPHHLGLLTGIGALLLYVLALWTIGGKVSEVTKEAENVTPWRFVWITLLTLLGLTCISIQAYQVLSGAKTPSPVLWLTGIGALAAVALIWDAQRSSLLGQTLAGLLLATGMALLLIGAGVAIAQPVNALPLMLIGLLLSIGGAVWMARTDSGLEVTDYGLMLGLGILALLLGIGRIWSWRYAFVGDEWGFFDLATTIIHRPELHTLFSVVDANAYHTLFSSSLQAWIMRLAGENVYGWRLSSLLPVVLSVPAVYLFARWLAGRTAAIVAAGLLAASHLLLSFTMAAYNNTQALLPLTVGLALFAFAQKRESAVRYYALGAALGSAFLLFGLARLVFLPIGILVLLLSWATWKRAITSTLAICAGVLAVATPLLFNLDNWRGLLKATPVQSEVSEQSAQLIRNLIGGGQAFLASSHNTHFVVGPHADPLTAALLLVGLAAAIAGWRRRAMLAWLLAGLTFWVAVSAIQQYEWVSTTRMFVLVPIYVIFAGVGAGVLGQFLFADGRRSRLTNPGGTPETVPVSGGGTGFLSWYSRAHELAWAGGIVAVAVLINQFHISAIANPQLRVPVQTLLVREFQESAASDRSGIPIYVVWNESDTARENMILRAYGITPDRIRFLTADEALSIATLCDDLRPQMLLIHAHTPEFNAIRDRIEACWPIREEMALRSENGEVLLYRFTTQSGVQDITHHSRPPAYRQADDNLHVSDPGDVVVDGAGHVFVLSRQSATVVHFDETGKPIGSFNLSQRRPAAMALTPDGHLIVSHDGPDAALIWYDGAGNPITRLPTRSLLAAPAGMAVTEDGDILIADAALRQVLRLTPDGQLRMAHTGNGQLQQPVAVTAAADGSFWVLEGVSGQWLKISKDDEVLATLQTDRASPASSPRLLVADDGSVLFTEPDRQRVVHVGADGQLLDLWSGFQRPSGIAVDGEGRILVVDDQLDRMTPIEQTSINVENDRGPVIQDSVGAGVQSRPENDAYADLDNSPFVSPISPLVPGTMKPLEMRQRYLTLTDVTGLTSPRAVGVGIGPGSVEPRLFVGDSAGAGMVVLADSGQLIGGPDPGSPSLEEISDIAVDPNGDVYALDSRRGQLHRFSRDGVYLSSVPGGQNRYGDARGLFVDSDNTIWIARTRQGNLLQLDVDGNELAAIPVLEGEGSQPVDVVVDENGALTVTDARTARLLQLSSSGELLRAWALAPFNSVDGAHLALDREGRVYVTLPEQGTVIRISADGTQRQSWLLKTPDNSRAKPVGIDVDVEGNIWTVDVDGNAVVMIEAGE